MSDIIQELEATGQVQLATYLQVTNKTDKTAHDALIQQLKELGIKGTFGPISETLARHHRVKLGEESPLIGELLPPKEIDPRQAEQAAKLAEAEWQADNPMVEIRRPHVTTDEYSIVFQKGLDCVKRNEVACVILAGGQGTRLGLQGPKGCFSPGFPSGNSLFEILIKRTQLVRRLGGGSSLPTYIMTSPLNDQETQDFFRTHKYFGAPEKDVLFFKQATMPSFDKDGLVFMAGPDALTSNPNGNGGVFLSLEKCGYLSDMKQRGVKYIHIFGVDNCLSRCGDPYFLGMMAITGAECGNNCCAKLDPHESVGVQVVVKNDQGKVFPAVIEYSEISRENAEARRDPEDPESPLRFSAASVCNHCLTVDYVEKLLKAQTMPLHVAEKKIKHWSPSTGEHVDPEAPNGYKLEYFVFDAFHSASKMITVVGHRFSDFAPLKNKTGHDSPGTAYQMLTAMHRVWLKRAGATWLQDHEDYEVDAGLSYDGEGLEDAAKTREGIFSQDRSKAPPTEKEKR